MKTEYLVVVFLLRIIESLSGRTPSISSEAFVVVVSGDTPTDAKLHCIGYFITKHSILTTCSCVGQFVGEQYVPYDRKKLRLYSLNFVRFTIVLSMRYQKCTKLTRGTKLFNFDIGNWMTKEEAPFWTEYSRTKTGDPRHCHFFNPKLKGNSSKIHYEIDKLNLALSSECATQLYDSRRTNATTRAETWVISHLLDAGGTECYMYQNSSLSDGIFAKGSPVFCDTYLSGIAITGGNGYVLVHTVIGDFYKYFDTIDIVEKSLSELTISDVALVGKVTIILLISCLSFLFI